MTEIVNNEQRQRLWAYSAFYALKAFQFRAAREAWRHARDPEPPVRWDNGVRMYREENIRVAER